MMLEVAASYPEYRDSAKKVQLVDTTSGGYYGNGYQDVQSRVPKIENTMSELGWKPQYLMPEALKRILDAYKDKIGEAASLNE